MQIHVVQKGDTLWAISQRYHVTTDQIVTTNQLQDSNRLPVGLALVIPTANRMHTVRSGETLWQIAQRYGTTIQAIVQANQLTNLDKLTPGMVIIIPARTHVVQPGESVGQIAQRYNTTVQEILRVNRISNPNLLTSGMVLSIPFRKPVIDVNAYTINTGEQGARDLREVGRYLTYSAPFAYTFNEDGSLNAIKDTPIIQASVAARVSPMMAITNFTFKTTGSQLARTILSSTALQDRLLTNILNTMRQKGYEGLNIDFENVFPADRVLYNTFLQRTVNRLHPAGYYVSTALAPKVSGEQKGLLFEAHDYPAHGRIADFVVLMTYEWGYRLGPPQSISPINQIRRVLDYAVTVIPRNKIFFGFQIYARDWLVPHVQGQEAETFSQQEAIRRAIQHGATIQYDTLTQSPFFKYTDAQGRRHEVWFEDARSAQAKFDVVKEYGVRGISYWALGYPYPQNWVLLEDNFSIRKLH
ncbi:LysM peptidoglycan-binding domain-containing protein [Neobacillus notoginsengisoli]|uniref:LysM peptidoglycan-binding domain-containing protein n=1 Tax=Neobacillus notoginsengisoli TaxID=1578198 RepID=A0A417YX23_9BACI|nr:LysM peptidoglycan-binding domain-containing protein [Neobacillus notoginsengisoli]RHW41982.1 LysM peptidoglycan-binding domain-containing protein [Neobacillus notoginsengisoli]